MFGLSLWEIGAAALVAFLIFGPEQFPVMIRQIMDTIKKTKDLALQAQQTFSNLSSDLESTISDSLDPIKNDSWSVSSEQRSNLRESSPQPELETISVDTNPNNYQQHNLDWEQIAKIDTNPRNYESARFDWRKLSTGA
jgi:Sec-independent protein translocase protein TatA